MSQQLDGAKTFLATSAVTAFRRVKLTASSGTTVEHAGAGEACIGVAQNDAGIGEPVTVRTLRPFATHKVCAAGPVTVGAAIYGAAAGKVDDAVSGTAQGTALEVATADGDIIEVCFDNGSAALIAPANVVNDAANEGAVPILIHKVCAPNATPDDVVIATAARKLKIVRAWMIARDATAANVTLQNGTDAVSGATAKGTADDTVVEFKVIAEYDEVAAAGVLSAKFSAQANVDMFVLAIPIA